MSRICVCALSAMHTECNALKVFHSKELFTDYYYLLFCFIEIFLMTTLLPAFILMRNGADPGEFMENADVRRQMYNNKDYQKELEYLLPHMLHLGYFD